MEKLTGKREQFCQEYVRNGRNASEAYRNAYDVSKMKPETIWARACELLKDGKVTVRISEIMEEYNRLSALSKEEAMRMMADFLRADITVACDADGTIDVNRLPEAVRPFVTRVRTTVTGPDVTIPDKKGVLELLGKWCGWEKPRDVNVNVKRKYKGLRIGFDMEDDQG